jgi:hypothetical protein
MDIDTDKVDEAVLALLYLGLHESEALFRERFVRAPR